MSKVNAKRRTSAPAASAVFSMNGNRQTKFPAEMELYDLVCGTMYGKDTFYETTDDRVTRMQGVLAKLVSANKFDFIANMAVYARTEMKMRTMPLVMVVHFLEALRQQNKTYANSRNVVRDVIRRADQLGDMLSYAITVFGSKNKMPLALKRGVADAFNKFDEYSFGKYKGANRTVSLRDALMIVHPSPKNDVQGEIFARIRDEQLAIPNTWETRLSANGSTKEKDPGVLWGELLAEEALGYMALMRNVRNIWESTAHLESNERTLIRNMLIEQLTNTNVIKRSGQLPFDFIKAIEVAKPLSGSAPLVEALNRAMEVSFSNIPKLGENVCLILDTSGSMTWSGSVGSRAIDQAATFIAAMVKATRYNHSNLAVIEFSTNAKLLNIDSTKSMVEIRDELIRKASGGGTNIDAAFDVMNKLSWTPDFIAVGSDGEVNPMRQNLNTRTPKHALKVAFNFANATGSSPMSQHDGWWNASGFSEKIFDLFPAIQQGESIVELLNVPYGTAQWKKQNPLSAAV